MQFSFTTDRLLIEPLTPNDNDFIFELVNTNGWLTYIGDRNVTSTAAATTYIQKILDNKSITYWVVKLNGSQTPVGIVTFIKRDYLEHPDIGFAFLPAFSNKGYAFEAAHTVLANRIKQLNLPCVLATTIPGNIHSIKLLKKLGFHFDKEIETDKEILQVYTLSADTLYINEISKSFFGVFTTTNNQLPNWDLLNSICIPEILLIHKSGAQSTVYHLASFIEPRKIILTNGTLTAFEEYETSGQTTIITHIAQRYSQYQKSGILEGKSFKQKGHKFLQFIKTIDGWKISAVTWEDEPVSHY